MASQRSFMPKKRKSYWSVSEIGFSPLKVDDDNDGRVGIWKAPMPGATAELKRSRSQQQVFCTTLDSFHNGRLTKHWQIWLSQSYLVVEVDTVLVDKM